MTYRIVCHHEAPSNVAHSYNSLGIEEVPVIKITIWYPNHCQATATTTAPNAVFGLESHEETSELSESALRAEFSNPILG